MHEQDYINIVIGSALAVFGWLGRTLWDVNGSTYIRTDGSGTTDNFYVRRGGAWVGMA